MDDAGVIDHAGNSAAPPAAERIAAAWAALSTVMDPEVPVLSLSDLGVIRDVRLLDADGGRSPELEVVLTPTYSGCPATEVIQQSLTEALQAAGLGPLRITLQRAPAWTTDWISPRGRQQLREYGIAPPGPVDQEHGNAAVPIRLVPRGARAAVDCPRCGSPRTERLSAFGATACKALYRCLACREPFEHFKPL